MGCGMREGGFLVPFWWEFGFVLVWRFRLVLWWVEFCSLFDYLIV